MDCVVVYKVDRLSRSLLDFARISETFERSKVVFVSVTRQFNTGTSMGRLLPNVLLSFAHFEREIISDGPVTRSPHSKERKMVGRDACFWARTSKAAKLVVNEPEAQQVREIFNLYARKRSLLARPVRKLFREF